MELKQSIRHLTRVEARLEATSARLRDLKRDHKRKKSNGLTICAAVLEMDAIFECRSSEERRKLQSQIEELEREVEMVKAAERSCRRTFIVAERALRALDEISGQAVST